MSVDEVSREESPGRTGRRAGGRPAERIAIVRPPGDEPLRYRDQIFTQVTVTRDLQYGSATNVAGETENLLLDLYRPTGDRQTERPAVVWVHGGGFSGGDKASGPSPDLARKFARLGYVTVSINYRLSAPGGCTESGITPQCVAAVFDAQHDAQAAVRWLRANADTYGIDETRIAIGGESAGGITATAVGLRSNDPGSSGNPGYSQEVLVFASISGGLPDGIFADSRDANGILFAGTADRIVPYQWSVDTVAALRRAGKSPFLESYPGAGQCAVRAVRRQIFTHTSYYFYWVMDLAHAAGQPAAAARAAERTLSAAGSRGATQLP